MLPLAGGWGLQQDLEAAAGCQRSSRMYRTFEIPAESTSHPCQRINSLIGENSTWRHSQATQVRLGSFPSAKETQAGETLFSHTTVPSRMGWCWCCRWPSGNELLMENPPACSCISPPSATMSNVLDAVLLMQEGAQRCREDCRTLLVLPEALKSTGNTPSSDSSLLRAGPCTTMKWFSCQ